VVLYALACRSVLCKHAAKGTADVSDLTYADFLSSMSASGTLGVLANDALL